MQLWILQICIYNYLIKINNFRKCCNDWGRHILRTWKNAPKLDKENQGATKRAEIETEIIEPLFHCAIFTKKPYSQRFQWVNI